MTSADSCGFSATSRLRLRSDFAYSAGLPGQERHLSARDHWSLQGWPLAAWDFVMLRQLIRPTLPQIPFVYLGPCVCLRLPSDSASRPTPLPLA